MPFFSIYSQKRVIQDSKVYLHLTEHLDSVKAINFSPDSLILASGSKMTLLNYGK